MVRRCKTCGAELVTNTANAVDANSSSRLANALEGSDYCLRHEPPDSVTDAASRWAGLGFW